MDCDQYDSIQLLSISDIVEIYYQMLKIAMDTAASEIKNKNGFDGNLLEEDAKNLSEFCSRNQLPPLSQALAELLTCLERHSENKVPDIRETAIYNSLLRLEKTMHSTSSWELYGDEGYDGPVINLTSFEINMIEQQMSLYITDLLGKNGSQTLFFPLSDFYSSDVIVKWRIMEKIASIKLLAQDTIYKQKLKLHVQERLKEEICIWLKKEIGKLRLLGPTMILKDAECLTKILKDLRSQVTMAIDLALSEALFKESGCSYFEVLTETVDDMLFPICEQVMEIMDTYQLRHREYHVNMRDSCALSHALYLQLKKLTYLLTIHGKTERPLKLLNYTNIFSKFFMNLLQVMKLECHNRIKRAVQAEMKDSVHSEEQILSSSVIVLNCLCTVIDEWKHMEIEDEEQKIAFLVKITDIVCDGAKIFAESLELRMKTMNFPLRDQDTLKKVCVLANSVEHVRHYLQELPQQMQWSEVMLEDDNEEYFPNPENLKEQVVRILKLIHESMNTDMTDIVMKMLVSAASGVHHSTEKALTAWVQSQAPIQHHEKFVAHLNDVLVSLSEILKEELFSELLSHLWSILLTAVQKNFQEGLQPEYAITLKYNILGLRDHFLQGGMLELDVHNHLLQQLMDLIDLNSKSTEELQLDYYVQIAESIVSPVEYLGHIAFQAGYKTAENDAVDLYINVQKGQRLPARKFEMCQLTVKVELCPSTLFPSRAHVKTSPATEDLDNPVFNECFQFTKLPNSVLNVKGAALQVLVFNQDYSYSAEAILLLSQVQNMSGFASLDFLPVYLMPLRKFDMSHRTYQVLENRCKWDKNAKNFINKRAKLSKGQKKLLSCIPGKSIMCSFSSND